MKASLIMEMLALLMAKMLTWTFNIPISNAVIPPIRQGGAIYIAILLMLLLLFFFIIVLVIILHLIRKRRGRLLSKKGVKTAAAIGVVVIAVAAMAVVYLYLYLYLPTKPITHTGDLIISGNQTFTIESCEYIQDGNIIVKDNATLVVDNARLILDQTERRHFIDIKDQAELVTKNASIAVRIKHPSDPELHNYDFFIRNQARVTIKETFISDRVRCYDSSHISVFSSRIQGRLYLYNTTTSSITTVDPFYFDTYISCYDHSNATIQGSTVCSVSCLDSSEVLIKDSNVTQDVSMSIGGETEATVSLIPGRIGRWNPYENETIETIATPNLTVTNSTVKGWSLICLQYTQASIANSTIYRIHSKDSSQVSVQNSTVDWIFSYDHSRVRSVDSNVTNLHPQDFSALFLQNSNIDTLGTFVSGAFRGTIGFNNATIDKEIYFLRFGDGPSQFYLFGNLTIKGSVKAFNGYMTRNYILVTTPDMELNVTNRDTGGLLWGGRTSSSGLARFDILFAPKNHTHTLLINNKKDFTLTSTTPLTMLDSSNG